MISAPYSQSRDQTTKSLGSSKDDSTFHPSEVNRVPGTPPDFVVQSNLSPHSASSSHIIFFPVGRPRSSYLDPSRHLSSQLIES